MTHREVILSIVIVLVSIGSSFSQKESDGNIPVGGPCEGCEALHEYGDLTLSSTTTLPDYHKSQHKLHISGTIYQKDGVTPASNIILYIYHTDAQGIYPKRGNEGGWARRHGYIRGWIRTGKDGSYEIRTFRPASYPNTTITAHIHATVKEPGLQEYYIDDFLFDDDPHLSTRERNAQPNRAGNGILITKKEGDILYAKRNIILGLNIPDYPN